MSLLVFFTNDIVAATWRASLLIALIFALRTLVVRWLPLKVLPWLWLLAAIKLLLVSAPSEWWSLYNFAALAHFSVLTPSLPNGAEVPAASGVAAAAATPLPTSTPTMGETWSWTEFLSIFWLLGVQVLAVSQVVAYLSFHRRLSRETTLSGSSRQSLLDECAALVGVKTPLLIETLAIGSPAVIGLFRPRLLVPHGLLDLLEPEETRLVFIHELSHLRRRDLWLLTLFAVTRTLHWFNPLVWLAERALRADCEAACDADVLRLTSGISESYGRALLRLTQLSAPFGVSVLVAAISTTSNQTQRRLQMIMQYQKPARWRGFTALAIVLGISILTLPNEVTAQDSTPGIIQKYKGITFSVAFNSATIEEALNFLQSETKRLDPDHQGVTFTVEPDALKAAHPVTLALTDVPLGQVLECITQVSNTSFVAKADAIDFVPSVGRSNHPDVVQPGDESGQTTARKLHALIMPKFMVDKMDIATVLSFLAYQSQKLDPDKKGINFVLGSFAQQDHVTRPVTIMLNDVPMTDVLEAIKQKTNLTYYFEGNVVTFLPGQ